jgi:hypothetical protein
MTAATRWLRTNEKPLENADRRGSYRPLVIETAGEPESPIGITFPAFFDDRDRFTETEPFEQQHVEPLRGTSVPGRGWR